MILKTCCRTTRFGLRTFVKNPGITAIAVLSLALATGATTAIFSVVNGVLLRPLPSPSPGVSCRLPRRPWCATISKRSACKARRSNRLPSTRQACRTFTAVRVSSVLPAVVSDRDLFDVLGAQALAGRTFRDDDQLVAVISEPLWRVAVRGRSGCYRARSHSRRAVVYRSRRDARGISVSLRRGISAPQCDGRNTGRRVDCGVPAFARPFEPARRTAEAGRHPGRCGSRNCRPSRRVAGR